MKNNISFFDSLSDKDLDCLVDIGKFISTTFSDYFVELTKSNFAIYKSDNLKTALYCFSIYKGKRVFLYRKESNAGAPVYYYGGDPFEHLDEIMKLIYEQIIKEHSESQITDISIKSNKENREVFLKKLTECSNVDCIVDEKYLYSDQLSNVFSFIRQQISKHKEDINSQDAVTMLSRYLTNNIKFNIRYYDEKELKRKILISLNKLKESLIEMINKGHFDFNEIRGLSKIAFLTSYKSVIESVEEFNFFFDYIC